MKKLLFFFAAGGLGGFANGLCIWLFGDLGIISAIGVAIAPPLDAGWLYSKIVWGGLWALLFVLPMLPSKPLLKGSILSVFPTIVQLFVVFPYQTSYGVAGLELGLLTPVAVLFFNWVWGVVTALTIRFAR